MNFKKISFLSVSLLTMVLSACGYGLKEYYEGDAYNSGNFQKDYYHVWNSKIDPNNSKNQIKLESKKKNNCISERPHR